MESNTDLSSAYAYLERLRYCICCPRECGVNRFTSERGFCQSGVDFEIGAICRHRGEEPVISGSRGICNVFFARCNMQCSFCQNYQISRTKTAARASFWALEAAVNEIERLLDEGCHAVGFVSPSHFIPQMLAVIHALRLRGRRPVVVMNTNGYDKVSVLRELDKWVDVYLPDLKYMDGMLARTWSQTPDYPDVARAALREMYRQRGSYLWLNSEGVAEKGLVIRHLVMPGAVDNSLACLRFVAEELSPSVHLSLMSQYHPTPWVRDHTDLGRTLYKEEYARVVEEMEQLGFDQGFCQPMDAHDFYRPDFARPHPFEWPRTVPEPAAVSG